MASFHEIIQIDETRFIEIENGHWTNLINVNLLVLGVHMELTILCHHTKFTISMYLYSE